MRTTLAKSFTASALSCALALIPVARVAAQQNNPCADKPCNVVFDWGGSATLPDPDRHFGLPSELEASFLSTLQSGGMHVTAGQAGSLVITVRLTPQDRVLCETMPGMYPDYSCHTVQRASVVFASSDASVKLPGRVDVSPRCSDPVLHPAYAAFGQFAAQTVIYTVLNGGKGDRPTIKCV
ncbi:MAG TPA: hypothetical protein VN706_06285 [Gemmatimonadaceae bacterium]|nr:hypothetical protein [Gemmatimonadaceae bacterium]